MLTDTTTEPKDDARVIVIREDSLVGRGSCTTVDERYAAADLVEAMDRDGVATLEQAVAWARSLEGLLLDHATNATSGEPGCPLIAAYDSFKAAWRAEYDAYLGSGGTVGAGVPVWSYREVLSRLSARKGEG